MASRECFRVSCVLLLLLAAAFAGNLRGEEFFSESFEDFFDDQQLVVDGGWTIVDENEPVETSTWTITNPGGRGNPPGEDGTPDIGQFIVSDSDAQAGSNPTGSGMSHDIWSPIIEVSAGASPIWLHMDCTAQLNNNGKAIFDVDVSIDEGATWTNVYRRVAPSRFEADPLATIENSDGFFGRLHIDVTEVLDGATEFQFRLRHFEPNWDWWIAADNILVDDQAPPQGGEFFLMALETFDAGIPPTWTVFSLMDPPNEGVNTWNTEDSCQRSVTRFNGGVVGGYQDGHGVYRLGDRFAILDSDCNPDPPEDEWLVTPVIDCFEATEVFLHYKDEIVPTGAIQEILLSLDGGQNFELQPLFSYSLGAGFDDGEEPFYAERTIAVPAAAGQPEIAFAFHYASGGDNWWWAIDDVMVTANGEIDPCGDCAARSFRVEPFDPATGSVTMSWNALAGACGDEGFRILANDEVISGDAPLPPDTTSFTDSSPPPGGSVAYSLQVVIGGEVALECDAPEIPVVLCPSDLACCVDPATGDVTLTWSSGANLAGQGWEVKRNGIRPPGGFFPFDQNSFTDENAPPGVHEYTVSLFGGDPGQCPEGALPLRCQVTVAGDDIILFESFDCYDDDAELAAAGWQSLLVNDIPADGSEFNLVDACDRGNPPTEDGTASQGKFVMSDNDCGGFSADEGSGQSYDLVSPSFDCSGKSTVWLHMDFSVVLNNNGECVVDVDASSDGGENWTNFFRRVAANRTVVEPFPQADIPEGFPGGPQEGNTDGFYGRLHLDISEVAANEADVRFRVRHFEPNYDWWVALDNVLVDTIPVTGGNITLLDPEGFDDGIPEEWLVESLDPDNDFAPWMGEDFCLISLLNSAGGVFPDGADGRQLHYFDERFALVAFDEFCVPAVQDELLATPIVDCSKVSNVHLHFRSSMLFTSAVARVLVSLDGGDTFDQENPIFILGGEEAGSFYRNAGNAEVAYNDYIFQVPQAAGQSEVVFAWHYAGLGEAGWWAIDDVKVTGDGENGKPRFVRGDSNADGSRNITDGVFIFSFLFTGGEEPPCRDAADTSDQGAVNITSGIYILNFLFLGGPEPPAPFPDCGTPEANELGCESFPPCKAHAGG